MGANVGEKEPILIVGHRLIDLSPIDVLLDGRVADDELVVGGASGMGRGDGDEGTHIRKFTLITPCRGLKQLGRNQIPVDLAPGVESLFAQIDSAFARYRLAPRPYLGCHYLL